MNASLSPAIINGIDLNAVKGAVEGIAADPTRARIAFTVDSSWEHGLRMRSNVRSYELGGQTHPRQFEIVSDEPELVFGRNSAANPQELLLAAVNSCMMVGYVVGAAKRGIRLTHLSIRSHIALDLRGAFGLDPDISPGAEQIQLVVRVAGDATPEQLQEIHDDVLARSPNHYHLVRPIPIQASLEIA